MIFISWGIIFCVIILTSHISSNELQQFSKRNEKALRTPSKEVVESSEGVYDNIDTYSKTGKRQTFVGMLSVGWLLYMLSFKHFDGYVENIIVTVFNCLIIWSLLAFTAEGLYHWNSSQKESYEEDSEKKEV